MGNIDTKKIVLSCLLKSLILGGLIQKAMGFHLKCAVS